MDFAQLSQLKDFLEDRPSWAFLAITITYGLVVSVLYIRSMHARIRDSQRWAPVTETLTTMMSSAASKAQKGRKRPDSAKKE